MRRPGLAALAFAGVLPGLAQAQQRTRPAIHAAPESGQFRPFKQAAKAAPREWSRR